MAGCNGRRDGGEWLEFGLLFFSFFLSDRIEEIIDRGILWIGSFD